MRTTWAGDVWTQVPLRKKSLPRVYPKYYLFEKKKKNLTVCLRDTTSVPRIVSGRAAIWRCTCSSENAHALRDDVKQGPLASLKATWVMGTCGKAIDLRFSPFLFLSIYLAREWTLWLRQWVELLFILQLVCRSSHWVVLLAWEGCMYGGTITNVSYPKQTCLWLSWICQLKSCWR